MSDELRDQLRSRLATDRRRSIRKALFWLSFVILIAGAGAWWLLPERSRGPLGIVAFDQIVQDGKKPEVRAQVVALDPEEKDRKLNNLSVSFVDPADQKLLIPQIWTNAKGTAYHLWEGGSGSYLAWLQSDRKQGRAQDEARIFKLDKEQSTREFGVFKDVCQKAPLELKPGIGEQLQELKKQNVLPIYVVDPATPAMEYRGIRRFLVNEMLRGRIPDGPVLQREPG